MIIESYNNKMQSGSGLKITGTKNSPDRFKSTVSKKSCFFTLIVSIFLLILSTHANALSSSGGGTWQYYCEITINNTGSALTDHQILVNLTGSAFPARANSSGADIRFEQGGAELSYWIEKWDYANASALVWVNVTSALAGGSSMRMWYGNDKAVGVSDANATFKRVIYEGQPLIGSWNFEESSGTNAYDSSGKGNHGTLSNGPGRIDGKFGKALNLDGVDDYVSLGNWFTYQTFTISMWVNPADSQVTYADIIDNNHRTDQNWVLQQNYNNVNQYSWGPADHSGISLNLIPYKWTQIVITRNSSTRVNKVYINGTLLSTATGTSDIYYTGTQFISLGRWGGGGRNWNGKIDEVNIYKSALTSSEISDIYNNYGYTTINYPGRVLVRKYTSPEPTLSIMPEQLNSNIAILTLSPPAKTTYPNYLETFTLWVNNTQAIQDNFTLSCPNCTFSENPVKVDSLQNKSISVNIISSSSPGLKLYMINATSQANSSNSINGYVYLTVDVIKWRTLWNDAYNNEFKFRLPLTISNSNPALNDYQLNFTIDSAEMISTGRMKSDCADIRVTNGMNEIPYWVETGCNTNNTRIWVKVPYIPAGESDIYLYSGNSNATKYSNGDNVFEFFDDFEGVIDSNKWQGDTAYFSVANGELKGTSTPYRLQSNVTFSAPVTQEVKARTVSVAGNGAQVAGFFVSTSNSFGLLQHSGSDYYRNDGSWPNIGKVIPEGNVPFKIIIKATSQVNYSIERLDNGQVTTGIVANSVSNERIALGKRLWSII